MITGTIPYKEIKTGLGPTPSYWTDSTDPLEFPRLDQDLQTDVVIVGGGIAGLSVAYTLAKEGIDCVVVERNLIGHGETARTSAHLANALDVRYFRLQKILGLESTHLAAQSHTAAIDEIARIVKRENITCNFERLNGYLFRHPADRVKTLKLEYEASRDAEINTELIRSAPGIRLREKIAIKFPGQAQFHPLRYLNGLSKCIQKHGGKIFTNTPAHEIRQNGISTNRYKISANHIVLATNSHFNSTYSGLKSKMNRTCIIGVTVHKDAIDRALWWDTGEPAFSMEINPYHYARIESFNDQYDLLICGGEDYEPDTSGTETTRETDRYNRLEQWVREHFSHVNDVIYKWSGTINTTPLDSLGYIGKKPGTENIYIINGGAGNGLTHGVIAGMLIPDLISNQKNPWERIYHTQRFPTRAADKSPSQLAYMTTH